MLSGKKERKPFGQYTLAGAWNERPYYRNAGGYHLFYSLLYNNKGWCIDQDIRYDIYNLACAFRISCLRGSLTSHITFVVCFRRNGDPLLCAKESETAATPLELDERRTWIQRGKKQKGWELSTSAVVAVRGSARDEQTESDEQEVAISVTRCNDDVPDDEAAVGGGASGSGTDERAAGVTATAESGSGMKECVKEDAVASAATDLATAGQPFGSVGGQQQIAKGACVMVHATEAGREHYDHLHGTLEALAIFETEAGAVEAVGETSWRIEFGAGSLSSLVENRAALKKFVDDLQLVCGADATVEKLCAGSVVACITTPRKK
jgi:hypothetical protein